MNISREVLALAGLSSASTVLVSAAEIQRFNSGDIRNLADAIREGIFDHAYTRPIERQQIFRVFFLLPGKRVMDHTDGLKCFTELQELAAALHEKYERTKDVEDLNMNIFVEKSCLDLSAVNGPPFSLLKSLRKRHSMSQSLEDLERVIKSFQRVVGLVDNASPVKPAILHNLAGYLMMRYDSTRALEDLDRAIESGEHAVRLSEDNDPIKPKLFNNLQAALHRRFQQSGNAEDLDAAIIIGNYAVALTKDEDPGKSIVLSNLAECLHTQYTLTQAPGDLRRACELLRESIALIPDENVDKPEKLDKLRRIFIVLYTKSGTLEDINQAIQTGIQAVSLAADMHTSRPQWLATLGGSFYLRFELVGSVKDLDQAIERTTEAINLMLNGGSANTGWFHSLASYFRARYMCTGELCDSVKAIENEQQAASQADDDKQVGVHLNNLLEHPSVLSISLAVPEENIMHQVQLDQSGDTVKLSESVNAYRQVLHLTPQSHLDQAGLLYNRALALKTQFDQDGDIKDLEESIKLNRQALNLRSHPNPDWSMSMNNLANVLLKQFEQKGDFGDLEESIKLNRQALDLRPHPNPDRSMSLHNLANALKRQFEQKGDLGDLEESIKLNRQALDLRPHPHPDQFKSLINLANALSIKFEQKGDLEDLEECIKLNRQTLDLIPVPHPLHFYTLNNLANALSGKFKQKRDLWDLEESIKFHRQALDLIPVSHPLRSASLNNLASALTLQFEQKGDLGDLGDLEESIKFSRRALDLTPHHHHRRYQQLTNLANALYMQFNHRKDLDDLEDSIKFHRQALDLTPVPHPQRHGSLSNLTTVLYKHFEQKGDHGDLEECVTLFREAAGYEFAPVLSRLQISRTWAYRADSHQHPSALEAYGSAINLLPCLASLEMSLQQRQEALKHARGLSCNAANCAIRNNNIELAVEFLSTGRSVFWTQALHLRTPLDDLEEVHPELAQRLCSIANTLESAAVRDNSSLISLTSRQKMDIEDQLSNYRKLNDDWISTLNEVRQTEGFEDFLQPMSFSKLHLCATNGPVILLNASQLGCDALIITLGGVRHVPLANMHPSLAVALVEYLQMSFLWNDTRFHDMSDIIERIQKYGHDQGHRGPYYGQNPDARLESILECLWHYVVLPVVTELQLQKSELPSNRLWWCPTGPFVFLPIHAAGVYRHGEIECMSNYCIPSYTSTPQNLLVSPTPSESNFRMLAVIQPEIPGLPNLPGAIQEMMQIEGHIPQPHDQYLVKLGNKLPATVAEVLKHLPNCSIAHFGCHGVQDPANPLNSGLHLQDGQLKISEIISCSIPKASLAYLSACETAKGDVSIPDEAMHIAGTMIFSGYHGVVGTMWPIHDVDAPKVADVFYRHLFQHGPHPNCTEAARALHLAMRELRDNEKNIAFHRWVPFVHYGV